MAVSAHQRGAPIAAQRHGGAGVIVGHAIGTQNYVCVPSASSSSGVAYALFTPEATLFSDDLRQLTTHFFSPSPSEINTNPAALEVYQTIMQNAVDDAVYQKKTAKQALDDAARNIQLAMRR